MWTVPNKIECFIGRTIGLMKTQDYGWRNIVNKRLSSTVLQPESIKSTRNNNNRMIIKWQSSDYDISLGHTDILYESDLIGRVTHRKCNNDNYYYY